MSVLKTHKPTGTVPWPTILLEGEEKAGKTWAAAAFSGDARIGRTFWIELGQEGCAEEYGAVPGADYEVVEHDGTWRHLMAIIDEIRDIAQATNDAGEPPVMLVIDTMTAEWQMLSEWADTRARRSDFNREKLRKNPDAEITISQNYWNDSNKRHNQLMAKLITMPAIVVLTAQSKLVSEVGSNGKPIEGKKVVTLDAQKKLGYAVNGWVRLSRDAHPLIIGLRSAYVDMRPDKNEPRPAPNFSLGWLIFDVMKCDPRTATARNVQRLDADQVAPGEEIPADEEPEPTPPPRQQPPAPAQRRKPGPQPTPPATGKPDSAAADLVGEFRKRVLCAKTSAEVRQLLADAKEAGLTGREPVTDQDGNTITLGQLITVCGKAKKAAEEMSAAEDTSPAVAEDQIERIDQLLKGVGARTDKQQLAVASMLLDRDVPDLRDLSADEVENLGVQLVYEDAAVDVARFLSQQPAKAVA